VITCSLVVVSRVAMLQHICQSGGRGVGSIWEEEMSIVGGLVPLGSR